MADYQLKQVFIEAIQWPGWTDTPWSEEFSLFFGANWTYVIKADNSLSPPKTYLFVSKTTWKPLPYNYYIIKKNGVFTMMSPADFNEKYEPVP